MGCGVVFLMLCSIACFIDQSPGFQMPSSVMRLPSRQKTTLPDNDQNKEKLSNLKRTFEEEMLNVTASVTVLQKQYGNVEKVSENVDEMKKQMKDVAQTMESLKTEVGVTSARLKKQCQKADTLNSLFLDEKVEKGVGELSIQYADASSSRPKGGEPTLAIDGNTNPDFKKGTCTHSDPDDPTPWWLGTLKEPSLVHMVKIFNRGDCCSDRLNNIVVQVYETDPRRDSEAVPKLCKEIPLTTESVVKVECNSPLPGKYIRILKSKKEPLTLCEVKAFGSVFFGKAIQTSLVAEAKLATDGDPNTCSETQNQTNGDTWWQVYLVGEPTLTGLTITNRDDKNYTFLSNFEVTVSQNLPSVCDDSTPDVCTSFKGTVGQGESVTLTFEKPMTGRFLRISKMKGGTLSLCEVRLETK